ncbi:MAG: cupredoxin domain-containing protein [Methylophagaceae bacterium]
MFLCLLVSGRSIAATPIIEIEIRNHLFYPSEVEIPVDTKVKLVIINQDPTAEEFESYELNREKVIPGMSKGIIFIGPLPVGEYPFFGEFFPKTAQGKVIVK